MRGRTEVHRSRSAAAREPLAFSVVPTEVRHGRGIYETVCLANGYRVDRDVPAFDARAVEEQLERFPQGQFVAVTDVDGEERVIGMGTTMRTRRSPEERPLPWMQVIGDYGLTNHQPDGDWLYGVEIAVHPDYQRRGVASALYKARLALVGRFGLKGWYAGGMLMGYHRYRDALSPREYAEKVIARELVDPTVTMQLNRGLEARGIIEHYYPEPKAGGAAVLIAWEPRDRRPDRPRRAKPGSRPVGARSAPPM